MLYKSIKEYAEINKVHWITAKRKVTKKELVKVNYKDKYIYIDVKEMLYFLVSNLIQNGNK